ncbi:MAG TPA: hypothetical protein VN688_01985 [Gemmataceae bacterium]|nr:hypothetical protein [Gemmataceae bacterium]
MRKSLSLAVLLAVVSMTAHAQDKTASGKPEPKKADEPAVVIVKSQLPRGWKALGLSAKQRTEILSTRAKYAAKRQALEEQIKALKVEEMTACEKVLTDAQRNLLKEKK